MSEDTKNAATAKDALFFQVILCSMKNKPDVDWSIVATKAGYKDGKTASTRYGQIMKKLTGVSAGKAMAGATSANSSPTKVSTPKKNSTGADRGNKNEMGGSVIGNGLVGGGGRVTKPRGKKVTNAKASWEGEYEEAEAQDYREWADDPEREFEKERVVNRERDSAVENGFGGAEEEKEDIEA